MNTLWLFIEYGVKLVINLIVGIYVARYLGPGRFGLLNFASSFVILFMPFAALGINSLVVRELVHDPEKRDQILGTAFFLRMAASTFVLILIFFILQFTGYDSLTNLIIMLLAGVFMFQSFQVIDFYFQSKVMSRNVVYAQVFSLTLSGAAKLLLVYYRQPLEYFAVVMLAEAVLLAIGLVGVYGFNGLSIFRWKIDRAEIKTMLRQAAPLILALFFTTIYLRVDQVMITEMMDNEANGHYAAAVKLSEMFYMVATILSGSLFPAIINALKISREEYNKRMQALFDLFTWIAIGASVFVAIFADDIIFLLYREKYSQAGPVLAIHFWASIFVFYTVVIANSLIAEKKQVYLTYNTIIGSILNIGLNYLLIPLYGIKGAAFATILSYFFSGYLFYATIPRTRNLVGMVNRSFNIKRVLASYYKKFLKKG